MKRNLNRLFLTLLLTGLLSLTGCLGWGAKDVRDEQSLPPPSQYLDFKDVKVPAELKLDRDGSFIYESSEYRAGVMALSGRMGVMDILDFYQKSMPQDGWTLLSRFKYHKNIMVYTKSNKVCLIMATYPYSSDDVKLEVWVAPSSPGQSFSSLGSGTGGSTFSGSSGLSGRSSSSAPKEETLSDSSQPTRRN
ncbi:MAG: hypothetical protein AB1641_27595 [Thermodesulfobacteriota bacterium]